MKKFGFYCVLLSLFFISCIDKNLPDVDGMWQLKTIEDETGNTQVVDTIYYSFESQQLFSFTQLNGGFMQYKSAFIMYGYVDFPAKDRMHIWLDTAHVGLFEYLPWSSLENTTYIIQKLTSKEMILKNEDEGNIYRFIKF